MYDRVVKDNKEGFQPAVLTRVGGNGLVAG